MSTLAVVRRDLRVLAPLAALELLLAWGLATATADALLAPLGPHPDGALALFTNGGRTAADLYLSDPTRVFAALLVPACAVVLYALFSVVLAALLPAALGAPSPRTFATAMLEVAPRVPRLFALAALSLLAQCLAVAVGVALAVGAWRATPGLADERARDLVCLAPLLLGALLALLARCAHDLARAGMVCAGQTPLRAARAALARLRATPRDTALPYALTVGASLGLVALELAAHGVVGPQRGLALAGLVAAQQVVLVAQFALRAAWTAHLARPYRGARP